MKRVLLLCAATMLAVSGFARIATAQTAPKPPAGGEAQPLAVLLEQGIYQEETAGNLDAAAKSYRQIVDQAAVGRALVAQALARLAALEVRQKQLDEARKTIERLKNEYPEQKDAIAKAERLLPNDGHNVSADRGDQDEDPFQQKVHVPTAEEKAQSAELTKQGWQKYRDGQFRLAEDLFRRAAKLDLNSADAWTGIGWAAMNSNSQTGESEFARALAIDPKNAMALNGMGWAMSHMGGTAEDRRRNTNYWQRAVEADPTATSPMRGLAQYAYQNADFDEAIKWYEKWLALDPKNADATAGLKQTKERQADVKAANEVATDFFKKLDDGQFADTRSLTGPRTAALFSSGEIHGATRGVGSRGGFPVEQNAEDWIEFLKKYRVPLGATVDRKLQSVQYSLNGRSVGPARDPNRGFEIGGSPILEAINRDIPTLKLEFATKYENKKSVVEMLTLDNTGDRVWKIRGYVIHETEAPRDPLKD